MNEQTPIMKIIILIIIIVAFFTAIYIIATVFATKCPSGQHFDKDQKKCILTCDDDEVYNQSTNSCRPICKENEVWSDSLGICKDCGAGSSWNETSQECLIFCGSDGECTPGQSCINGQCCNYPACKTKDGDKCCETCNPDPNNSSYSICCASNKIYTDKTTGQTACCSAGQISNGVSCQIPCGPAGSTKVCSPGNECLTIKNVDPKSSIYNELKGNTDNLWEQNTDGTYNCYSCMGTKDLCNSKNAQASPASIGNFYPCLEMGDDLQASDILSKDNLIDFNKELQQKYKQGLGHYCGNNQQDLARLYRINFLNKDKCNYANCVAAMANPYVTDIQYDETTGNCTSLQSCTQNISGLNVTSPTGSSSEPDLGQLPDCSKLPTDPKWFCNNKQQLEGNYCEPNSGLIQIKGYNCHNYLEQNPPNIGTKSVDANNNCVCYPGSVGNTCQFSRDITCSKHGTPDPNTGTCKCDTFWVGTNCDKQQLSTDYYNDAWVRYKVNELQQYSSGGAMAGPSIGDLGWELFYVILINNNGKYIYKDWNNLRPGAYFNNVPQTSALEYHFLTPTTQGNGRGVSFQLLSAGGGPTYNLIFNINPNQPAGGIWYQMGTDQGYGREDGIPSTPPPPPAVTKLYQPSIFVINCTKYADGTN